MQQLTAAITDEELGGAPFVIVRSVYRQSQGEKEHIRDDRYETYGTVHPAKLSDLELLPEEYRHETVLIFHSPVSLSLGIRFDDMTFTAPDRILYRFRTYLVISVRDWSSFGFCKALAVLRKEAES